MRSKFIARIRHLLLGPGRHRRKPHRPEPARITPEQFRLMFSGQSAYAKRWPHKLGIEREYRYM